jgi:hypothetical protein
MPTCRRSPAATIDALCYCLGEFRELTACVVSQRDRSPSRKPAKSSQRRCPTNSSSVVLSGTFCRVLSGPRRHQPSDGLPGEAAPDFRCNVAQLYARLADCIRNGNPVSLGFDAAVTRHPAGHDRACFRNRNGSRERDPRKQAAYWSVASRVALSGRARGREWLPGRYWLAGNPRPACR